ncbi:MAG TPA: AbrB/MazE/SpoVT family DNA-binding domain-containing protein [bacterium]|nr:AbrB/MazE/SpoVT family DNA-binding domain-containing protein [bacterium]
MNALTIPKKLIKNDDLVIIPRREYEKFLRIFKMIPKSQWWFWSKEWQAKEMEAEKDIKSKKLSGPYKAAKDLKMALDNLKR